MKRKLFSLGLVILAIFSFWTYQCIAKELRLVGCYDMDSITGFGVDDITWDGEFLWGIDSNKYIVKIDRSTFEIVDWFEAPELIMPDNIACGIAYGGGYLWIVEVGAIGAVDRNGNIDEGKTIYHYHLRPLSGGCWDGQYLWTIEESQPLTLVKVDVNRKEIVDHIRVIRYSSMAADLVCIDGFLWTVTEYIPESYTPYLIKVDPNSGEVLEKYEWERPFPFGLAYDGNYLIASSYYPKKEYCIYTFGEFEKPVPDIKINGSDGPITLDQSDTITIIVALDNKGRTENADWWLAADTPFGLFFFTFDGWTGAWVPGYQSPLSYLDSFEVLTMPVSGLRAGTYTLYFGVDTVMDGNVTWDSVYYDIVEVNIIGYSYLLEKYAPVLKFCYLNEERYLPTRVEDMIEHSELRVHIVVPSERPDSTPVLDYWDTLTPVLDQGDFSEGITAKELSENSNITEAYFNLDDDYLLTWSASQCVVYGRVVPSGDYTYLQYWFFYVYNNWENEHESDWEMITVELDKDMIPQRVGYSQHTKVPSIWKGGEVVPWEKVEENGHPVVYVAKGSHASYPTSGSTNVPYPLGDKVFWGIDWHPGNFAIEPSSSFYQLLRIDDEASRYWEWIKIDKLRWGKDSGWGGSPSSPVVQGDKWSDPGAWMDSLQ